MQVVHLNGHLVPRDAAFLPISDLGLRRGYAAFEFFRVVDGLPLFLEDHLDRLAETCRLIDLPLPYDRTTLDGFIRALIHANALTNAGIQLVLTGGNSPDAFTPTTPNLLLDPVPLKPYPETMYTEGVKLITHRHVREVPAAKTTAYLTAVIQGKRQQAEAAAEVVYHDGTYVSEAGRSSLLLVKNGVLVTAQEGVLEGITRKRLLQVVRADALLPVACQPIPLADLFAADEVLITSTTRGVMPATRIDDAPIGDGRVGPVARLLRTAFAAHVAAYLDAVRITT